MCIQQLNVALTLNTFIQLYINIILHYQLLQIQNRMGNEVNRQSSNQNQRQQAVDPSITLYIDQKETTNVSLSAFSTSNSELTKYKFKQTFNIGFSFGCLPICMEQKPTLQAINQPNISWLFLQKQQNIIIIDSNFNKWNDSVAQILPKSNWYELNQNDKFKIGRSIFRFIQSGDYKVFKSQKKIRTTQGMLKLTSKIKQANIKQQCKICFQDTQTEQNPLISPCNCSGSIQNIHLACLNQCIFNFKQIGDNIIQIQSKSVICDICKAQFSQQNKYYDQIISFLLENYSQMQDNSKSITIIQAILENKKQEHKKTFYIISFKENQVLQFGRQSNFAGLKQDTSISRKNTSLKFQNSKVKIRDQNSTNGTGVLLKFPYVYDLSQDKIFRVGKKLFKICNKQSK